MFQVTGVHRIVRMAMASYPAKNIQPGGRTTNNKLTMTLASDRNYVDGNGEKITDFVQAVAWNGLGENIEKYCKIGDEIYLEDAHLRTSKADRTQDVVCPKCTSALEIDVRTNYTEIQLERVKFLRNGRKAETASTPAKTAPVRVKDGVSTVTDEDVAELVDETNAPY